MATAHAIMDFEPVRMVVDPQDRKAARAVLSKEIELLELPVNDSWVRDTAPLFLTNDKGELRATGFQFNGWGAKFPLFSADGLLKARLCKEMGIPFYPMEVVSEGGAVLVDGEGTIIATEQCLLHRNPDLDAETIEKRVMESLGAEKMVWLGKELKRIWLPKPFSLIR